MARPYPSREQGRRVAPTRTVCRRCGVTAADPVIHEDYHLAIEERVSEVQAAIADLTTRVAALEAPAPAAPLPEEIV